MNEYYEKYLKGKTTSLLVKVATKDKLNKLRYELEIKSTDELINLLLLHYENNK